MSCEPSSTSNTTIEVISSQYKQIIRNLIHLKRTIYKGRLKRWCDRPILSSCKLNTYTARRQDFKITFHLIHKAKQNQLAHKTRNSLSQIATIIKLLMPRGRQRKLNTMKSSNASRSNKRTTLIKRPRGRPKRIPQPSSDSTAKKQSSQNPRKISTIQPTKHYSLRSEKRKA